MADLKTCPPLTRSSVQTAHARIRPYIHLTPTVTCETLNRIASTPQSSRSEGQASDGEDLSTCTANPKVKLFFKCENQQRIGAFKARGAFHALGRLIEEEGLESVRKKGVVTHSSGMYKHNPNAYTSRVV
jgi:threonine dehydratase